MKRLKNTLIQAAATVALVGIAAGFVGPWIGAAMGYEAALAGAMVTAPVAILIALKLGVDWLAARC